MKYLHLSMIKDPQFDGHARADPHKYIAEFIETCGMFRIDVLDEVTEEELNALLDDSEPFKSTSQKINETDLDKEFAEFMEVKFEEFPEVEEEADDNFEELTLEKMQIKKSIQESLTDLEMKPLPAHLAYAYLDKDFFPCSNHIFSTQRR
ncbi:hypothetical protein Tco_1158208 [Tanacetum coccineum]